MPSTTHEPDQFAPHLGVPTVRPICTGEADLMLHDPYDGPGAWLAMQDAPHCHD